MAIDDASLDAEETDPYHPVEFTKEVKRQRLDLMDLDTSLEQKVRFTFQTQCSLCVFFQIRDHLGHVYAVHPSKRLDTMGFNIKLAMSLFFPVRCSAYHVIVTRYWGVASVNGVKYGSQMRKSRGRFAEVCSAVLTFLKDPRACE